MFILIFIFLDNVGKAKVPWDQPTLNFSVNAFVFISVDPQYMHVAFATKYAMLSSAKHKITINHRRNQPRWKSKL